MMKIINKRLTAHGTRLTAYGFLVVSCLLLAVSLLIGTAYADRGYIPISADPNIRLSGLSQKAIIAWNGSREAMILSTDLSANKRTKIIGFLPLPSYPSKYEKCGFSAFKQINNIINRNYAGVCFDIKFYKQADLHDLKSVYAENIREFINWVKAYYLKLNVKYSGNFEKKYLSVIKSYIDFNSKNYVFNSVVAAGNVSTEPVMYVFDSAFLYYPLRISSINFGKSDIKLFLITEQKPNIWATESRFSCGKYNGKPIKFRLSKNELKNIHPEIYNIFKDSESNYVWMTVAGYYGDLRSFKKDFKIYK